MNLISHSQSNVPTEVLIQVLSYLDLPSILSCMRVSQFFNKTIEDHIWKITFFRDFSHYLYQAPLTDQDLSPPTEESHIQMIKKEALDPSLLFAESPLVCNTAIKQQILREAAAQLQNWKCLYIIFHRNIDLSGYWVGDYGRHGMELIQIYQKGYEIIAKKITGDENVPEGEVTWKMTLDRNMRKGKGFMQVAEIGHKNASWVTAYLEVYDDNSLQITWFVYDLFGNWYSSKFGTVRAGASHFDKRVTERKVDLLTFGQGENAGNYDLWAGRMC